MGTEKWKMTLQLDTKIFQEKEKTTDGYYKYFYAMQVC